IILSVALMGIAMLGMGIKVLFTKTGEFPDSSVSANSALRKKKIYCIKTEQVIIDKKTEREEGVKYKSQSCEMC
ncbi:MAG TPA: hypothetical protein DCQ31_04360, partial [Bacteroidales bacterium]|nr:hypothetical protein [Bacteroidales bacterium]